jgi:hypothetical protein
LIKDLNLRPETMKLLEENREELLHNIGLGKALAYNPKSIRNINKNK